MLKTVALLKFFLKTDNFTETVSEFCIHSLLEFRGYFLFLRTSLISQFSALTNFDLLFPFLTLKEC